MAVSPLFPFFRMTASFGLHFLEHKLARKVFPSYPTEQILEESFRTTPVFHAMAEEGCLPGVLRKRAGLRLEREARENAQGCECLNWKTRPRSPCYALSQSEFSAHRKSPLIGRDSAELVEWSGIRGRLPRLPQVFIGGGVSTGLFDCVPRARC